MNDQSWQLLAWQADHDRGQLDLRLADGRAARFHLQLDPAGPVVLAITPPQLLGRCKQGVMSLVEVMVSSVLVGISNCATGVWNQAAALVLTPRHERRAAIWRCRVAPRNARQKGQKTDRMSFPAVGCGCRCCRSRCDALAEGITRQWTQDSQLRGLQELALVDDEVRADPRRQLLSPAAFGLCRS